MKITVIDDLNPVDVIRRAGYGQVRDPRATEQSWSRRLGSGVYPRYHAYINGWDINLHLDQKQASYEGYGAHSGEYDGEAVEAEVRHIILAMDALAKERRESDEEAKPTEKSGFWGRLFG